jgi:hypothetical protein
MVNDKIKKVFFILVFSCLGSKNRIYNNQRQQQQQLSTNNLPFYRKYFIEK